MTRVPLESEDQLTANDDQGKKKQVLKGRKKVRKVAEKYDVHLEIKLWFSSLQIMSVGNWRSLML